MSQAEQQGENLWPTQQGGAGMGHDNDAAGRDAQADYRWCQDATARESFDERSASSRTRTWVFKPNCSLTPRQLAIFYLSIVCVTLGIAAGFCMFGMWMVLPFAGIELLVVGIALLVYARHAGDYEEITLNGRQLNVAVMRASRLSTVKLNPGWTHVVLPGPGRDKLLRLECGGTCVLIGRYVTETVRERLGYELRRALAAAAV